MAKVNLPELPGSAFFIDGVMSLEWQEFFRSLTTRVSGEDNIVELSELIKVVISSAYIECFTPKASKEQELERLIYNIDEALFQQPIVDITETFTSDYTITQANFEHIIIFDTTGGDINCNLPSIGNGDIGKWLIIVRKGINKLTITAADADIILDSSPGGTITSADNTYDYHKLGLRILFEDRWDSGPDSFGIWSTR